MTHAKACIRSEGDWICAGDCTHDADEERARLRDVLEEAAALLSDWRSDLLVEHHAYMADSDLPGAVQNASRLARIAKVIDAARRRDNEAKARGGKP